MADYSTVPPPSSGSAGGGGGGGGGGGVNDAFKDALQRARQVSLDRAAGSRQLTVIGRWLSRPLLLRAEEEERHALPGSEMCGDTFLHVGSTGQRLELGFVFWLSGPVGTPTRAAPGRL